MSQNNSRLDILEERLKVLTVRVDSLARDTDSFVRHVEKLFNSDGKYPGLYGRIISLEEFKQTTKWMIGVLYSAFVGLMAKMFMSNMG